VTDAVAFDDVRRWLALFAHGLGDRAVLIEPVDGVHATIGRDRAVLADPTTIRVPTTVGTNGGHRIAALRQLGIIGLGTVDADTSDLSPRGHRAFLALEDLRIDAAIGRRYTGARTDLALVAALDSRDDVDELVAPFAPLVQRDGATAFDSLRIARELADDRGDDGIVTPIGAVELAELLGESVPDAPGSTSTLAADVPDGEAMPADQMIDGATLAVLGELDLDVEASQDGGGVGSVVPDLAGDTQTDSDEAPRDADVGAASIAGRRVRARRPSIDGTTFVYDEWSYVDGAYLRAWCHLTEHRLRGDDFAFIGDVRRRYAVLASQVKRRFAFARTEGWHRVHRTTDGDELELDAVIEAIVDRRAGLPMHDRLHVRRDRAAREVTTAFLVDLSASTSSPIVPPTIERERAPETEIIDYRYGAFDDLPGPTEPPRRVIDIAKEALALMCDALGVLGDRHAVYGFSGEGRDNVEFQVAKDFDDAVSLRTWAALAAMAPRRYTRMGPAIRHATAKLRGEAVRTKILVVVSDGYPQDVDYGPDRFDKEYGVQDTACALREAESAGVTTFCITIDPAGHDYLRRMSPESHYLVIDDVTALPALTSFAPGLGRAGRR
jgi:nitric oxide reductase NorD protein